MTDQERETRMAERARERLQALLVARFALSRDRALAEELAHESQPVIAALLEEAGRLDALDADAQELREAVALASLLGRRAAWLGASPTAVLELSSALLEALELGSSVPELGARLLAVSVEGFVAAREEMHEAVSARQLADAIGVIELVPGCFAVIGGGAQDPSELERVVEGVGRRLFEKDARACLVHVGGMTDPDAERAAQLFGIHATCRMLGVACVFSAVDEAWLSAARERGISLEEVTLAPDFAVGLEIALEQCELEVRHRSGLGGVLRRLVGRR